MTKINQSIFREYDIRGIVETDLPDEVVVKIASAFAAMFVNENKKKIIIGMDARPHSENIYRITIDTLSKFGLEIIEIGLVPTPVMYYAVHRLNADGGLVITASHNPSEYNGFKALLGKAALFGSQIREIYDIAVSGKFPPKKTGKVSKHDILEDYYQYILKDIKLNKKVKVVIDCGNGTGGVTAPELYKRLKAEVISIFEKVDGTFPNHHPDPTKEENLRDLIEKVKQTGADLGIGFDGDGDRIGVVDSAGNILWGDQLMIIFSEDILKKHPGGKIISEVKASEKLYSEISRMGGVPIMWKTGHSLIKKKIHDENAIFAGEMSGHLFFNDRWFGFDDAVYAGARLLEILSNSDKSLTEIYAKLPKAINTPEIREKTTEEAKFKIVAYIIEHFRKEYEVIDIDGARIKFPRGWALVRASNTGPDLVIRFEADSREDLEKIKDTVYPLIKAAKTRFE
jgi:phosphomannomutase